MSRIYTKSEEMFLYNNYSLYGAEFCAKSLSRSSKGINIKANKMGLYIPHDKIVELRKIGKIKRNEDYDVNPSLFYTITMPEVAYFLGYFWADGYLKIRSVKGGFSYNFVFTILYDDYLYIKKVLNKIGKWRERILKVNVKTKRINKAMSISTGNMPLVLYLSGFDFELKSHCSPTKILNTIPDHLKHYFWRGYMDGDGSFVINKSSCACIAGTLNQDWTDLEKKLSELLISFNTVRRPTEKEGGSSVIMTSCKDIYFWGRYIYKDYEQDQIGLPRKYKRWKEAESKYKEIQAIKTLVINEDSSYLEDINNLGNLIEKYSGVITRGFILKNFKIKPWDLYKEIKKLTDKGFVRLRSDRWPSPYCWIGPRSDETSSNLNT